MSGDTQELRLIARDTPRHIVPSTRVVALPPQTGAAALAFYRGEALAALQGDLLVAAQEGRYLLGCASIRAIRSGCWRPSRSFPIWVRR